MAIETVAPVPPIGVMDFSDVVSVATEAGLCWDLAKAQCPKATQIVVGPYWRNGVQTMATAFLDVKDALKAKAAAYGFTFIDPLEMEGGSTLLSYSTTLSSVYAGSTSISTVGQPPKGLNGASMTIEVGTGAVRERTIVTAWAGAGPYTATVKAMTNAHAAGEPVTVVGPSHWTGTGKSGTPVGDGNSDVLVGGLTGTDPTHPTQAGHDSLARTVFGQLALRLPY